MEVSGLEKFSRYVALAALAAVIFLGGLAYLGVLKMPGSKGAAPKTGVQTTLLPRRSPSNADGAKASASGSDQPAGAGSFQSDSLAAPAAAGAAPEAK